MSKKASDLFSAESQSIKALFHSPGTGFYIPAYQRSYTWEFNKGKTGNKNINRLFDDIFSGMQSLLTYSNSYTFLGAVILVDDKNKEMINPTVKFQQPDKVLHIIDGQQRITTVLMILVELHRYLSDSLKTIERLDKTDLHSMIKPFVSILKDCIYVKKEINYPKMIRSLTDRWSEDREIHDSKYEYASAISHYVFNYLEKTETPLKKGDDSEYAIIYDAVKNIKEEIQKIAEDNFSDEEEDNYTPVQLAKINQDHSNYKELLGKDAYNVVDAILKDDDVNNAEIFKIIRVYIFAMYVINRVAVTSVIANDDTYAFSIFEALNTTGEPLTAFETFKPKVIEKIGLSKYKGSLSASTMDAIEKYISVKPEKVSTKIKHTEGMIIYFGLSENGTNVGKKLSEQRTYMKNTFDNLNNRTLGEVEENKETLNFVDNLLNIAELTRAIAWDKKITLQGLEEVFTGISDTNDSDYGCLCALEFLKSARNSMSIPVLSRFYKISKVLKDKTYLVEAIKATAAFFALWRSVKAGTAGIDNCYRYLMSNGLPNGNEKDFFARYKFVKDGDNKTGYRMITSNIEDSIVNADADLAKKSLDVLKKSYRYILKYGSNFSKSGKTDNQKLFISNRDSYVQLIQDVDMYTKKAVAKYLLMVATDGNTSKEEQGIELANRHIKDDNSKMLQQDNWSDKEFNELEYIAPEYPANKKDWHDVYDDDEDTNINLLGNLIIFPKSINLSIENQKWEVKKQAYSLYSSDLPADHVKLSENFNIDEYELKEVLNKSKNIYMVKKLAEFNGDWNKETILKRTRNVAELAWEKLGVEYLGFKE